MSVPMATEKRMLTANEFEAVRKTHYPDICAMGRDDLVETAKLLREYRNKARDVSRRQRREMRGKADPRGARPAADNTGTSMKKQIFASALKRLNSEIRRADEASARAAATQSDLARRALELKRANRVRHHPSAGRTAGRGMSPNTSDAPTVTADPREVGRVSQFVKDGQARRDAR
ncbi:hypothetical protein [Azospirillum halopraeferens]|uniref:hypothetical protein n=1 Tax=Azospirillum halopraeferens TaxID=34010 RepID=UPI0004056161|nr:hypothetical protein [Azospirillum halopraeferens]